MVNIKEVIGERIKSLRVKKGFSQEKLAELADLDRTYIFSIESGKRNISIEVLLKIATALETKVATLIDNIEDEL